MTEELKQAAQAALEALDEIHAGIRHHQLALAVANNLRRALTQRPAAQEREAFEAWLRTKPEARLWNTTDAMLAAYQAGRASLPTQPAAQTDNMGMPTSCGKPLCAPDEHHPLCDLHKSAAQATPEPVGEPCRAFYDATCFAFDVRTDWKSLPETIKHRYALAEAKLTHPAPGVPEIDYSALIHAAWGKHKYAQGTGGCIAFKRGAEWFRDIALAAHQPAKETR